MQTTTTSKTVLVDGSRLVIEAMARAGAGCFIGYPITPANLLYQYASRRFPLMLPAADEITTVQWMSGLSACGHIPVTATSFPGMALMVESVNMAFMMELPMVIILVQRLGPATGTATCGAQGDIALLRGMISGGHQVPVLCPADQADCWNLAARSVSLAGKLRTPVVLLTSKEEMMTVRSFDMQLLEEITPLQRDVYNGPGPYRSYFAEGDSVPPFLSLADDRWQVRLNASTHDMDGILQHSTEEAISNTRRLDRKSAAYLQDFTCYDLDEQEGAGILIVSYGITAAAARDAVRMIREGGNRVSLLIAKTLLPVPDEYYNIAARHDRVVVAEENINAGFASVMYGDRLPGKIVTAGGIGRMIGPGEIIKKAGL